MSREQGGEGQVASYPIPVERLMAKQALTIVCERCHAEAVIHADDLLNEGLYECPADTELSRKASAAGRCRGSAIMKYEEAECCRGCGTLGFYADALNGCCSRKCMLQADYAAALSKARP